MDNPLCNELLAEIETTKNLLAAAPEEKMGWKPHPKSLSLGQLCRHIAEIPGALTTILASDEFDFNSRRDEFPACNSSEELLRLADESCAKAVAEINSWDNAKLLANWRAKKGDAMLMEVSRAAGVRTLVLNHLYHHRGQLSVYLRLLEVPLPSTYGPTADVNPFA